MTDDEILDNFKNANVIFIEFNVIKNSNIKKIKTELSWFQGLYKKNCIIYNKKDKQEVINFCKKHDLVDHIYTYYDDDLMWFKKADLIIGTTKRSKKIATKLGIVFIYKEFI